MARKPHTPYKVGDTLEFRDDFDLRVCRIPEEWSKPLSHVVDTLDSVVLALERYGWDENDKMALELTKLVLDRHDKGL